MATRKTRSKKRGARKSSFSIITRLYAPFRRVLNATGNSVRTVSHGVGDVAGKVVNTVNKVGQTYARGANKAISNITRRKTKKNRK